MFGTLVFRHIQQSGKLVEKGSQSTFIGHVSNVTTTHYCSISNDKWCRSPFFRFYQTFSSAPSHSLILSFRNEMGTVKLEEA